VRPGGILQLIDVDASVDQETLSANQLIDAG